MTTLIKIKKGDKFPKDANYPPYIMSQAKELFFRGYSLHKIAEAIKEATGKKCVASLIHAWKEKDTPTWEEQRNVIRSDVSLKLKETTEVDMVERAKEQLEAYQKMTQAGSDFLGRDFVIIDKATEAGELIDKGVKGERMISAGLISWSYIERVVQIICEEVKDEEIRRRLATRLQLLTQDLMGA